MIAPPERLILAQVNEIPLRIHGRGLTGVFTAQTQYREGNRTEPDKVGGGDKALPVLYHADGGAYIDVVPLRLGKTEIKISGRFPDGGVFVKRVMVDVEPPKRQPQQLTVGRADFDPGKMPLYLHKQPGRTWLVVNAAYDNLKSPISIDPGFVSFRMRTNDQTPPIGLDETTGLLTPLHTGHALVETTFGGLTTLTCVVVNGTFDITGANRDRSHCEELLEPGEKLFQVAR